jgi:hypothetical protein
VAALLLLVAAPLLRAADEPKPNTLTPKEIADGWILLFDGESTFGWTIDGEAKVEKGVLILGGEKETTATTTTAFAYFTLKLETASRGEASTMVHGKMEVKPKVNSTFALLTTGSGSGGNASYPIRCTVPAGSQLSLRNVKLQPEALKSIFNGKDLSDWKKFETDKARAKSEFSVNKDGELTIKNGPGDLQSEGQWADFILQIECKTNGKNLNSGVFFRCIPNEYQNGYEAQIHNGWTEKPDKEYTIEEYDPKTNELKGKTKIKSASMDYGTGAIYRRIPARQAVAKDNEWFTMTVAAQGRHIATWVDGIQVVDWTDNRKLNDNPRNGCRLEKGPISLQGHDPTTDLNFRNIRIAKLPAKK